MGSGFPQQCSPTTTWPQEVVSGELGFRESFAAQAPLRATLLSLASQAPGAEVWVSCSSRVLSRTACRRGFHAENLGLWPKVKGSYLSVWIICMFFVCEKCDFLVRNPFPVGTGWKCVFWSAGRGCLVRWKGGDTLESQDRQLQPSGRRHQCLCLLLGLRSGPSPFLAWRPPESLQVRDLRSTEP